MLDRKNLRKEENMTDYTKKIKANLAVLKRPTGEKNADKPKMYPAVLPRLPKGEHWGGWEKYEKDHPEEKGLTMQEQMANATNRAFGRKKTGNVMKDWVENEKRAGLKDIQATLLSSKRKPEIQEE
jgi:hypothetical protein